MAWTTPATVVTGDIITAAYGNTYVRDNTAYLKALLDGTGGAIVVTTPDNLKVKGSEIYIDRSVSAAAAQLRIYNGGGVAEWTFRQAGGADHPLRISKLVGGGYTDMLIVDPTTGKFTGASFYDSGVFAVTAGATVTLTHGFGAAQPRFVWGYWNTGALDVSLPLAAVDAPAGAHRFGQIFTTAGTIDVINGGAATINARVYAMR